MDQSFLSIFDLFSLGCGAYLLYSYYKLRATGGLFKNGLLIPNGKTPKDCLDEEGYISYMGPRLLILGLVIFLFGVVSLINGRIQLYGILVSEILTVISLAFIVWYGFCIHKANKLYW